MHGTSTDTPLKALQCIRWSAVHEILYTFYISFCQTMSIRLLLNLLYISNMLSNSISFLKLLKSAAASCLQTAVILQWSTFQYFGIHNMTEIVRHSGPCTAEAIGSHCFRLTASATDRHVKSSIGFSDSKAHSTCAFYVVFVLFCC